MTALISLLFATAALAQDVAWKEIYTQKEVAVSRASVPGTKLVAFKGDTVMDASVGKVLAVLLDDAHRLEWVGRLEKNQVLTQSSPYDYVVYQAFGLPMPFSDRDYVYRAIATHDPATGVVVQTLESVEHPDAPETIGVRANLVSSKYVLTPLPDGSTRVVVEILTDPMGSMPVWLVNLIQRSWPRDTLTGIRTMLGQSWVTEHPLP